MKEFLYGILGGLIIVTSFLIYFVANFENFNYQVRIVNPESTKHLENFVEKERLLRELEHDKIVLTPAEYLSNISNFYSTAITILIGLFVVFSGFSFFQIKNISKEQVSKDIEKMLRSDMEIHNSIKDVLFGEADEKFAYNDDLNKLNTDVQNILTDLELLKEENKNGEKEIKI